jgi:hypothetical protein
VWNNKQEYNLTRMNAIYVQQFTQFIIIILPFDPNIKPDLSKLKKTMKSNQECKIEYKSN